MGVSVFDQEASFGRQVLKSCAVFLVTVATLILISAFVFFDFSMFRSGFVQTLKFPIDFFKDLLWIFWVFAWFGSVCFAPILLLSLLAERELRQVRQRFGRLDTGRVKAIRGTKVVLSVVLVGMFFISGTILAPHALLERFGPSSAVTELGVRFVTFLESRMQETGDLIFDDENKSFPRSRLVVFVPVSYLSGSESEASKHFRGFHRREVLMNVTTEDEAFHAVKSGMLLGGKQVILGESTTAPVDQQLPSCAESCSPDPKNLAELFVQSQPFLIGFQRVAGFLPFFRSVLPSASHFVNDDFLKLRSAERQLVNSSDAADSIYVINLNGELSDASGYLGGTEEAAFMTIDRTVLAKRRDVAWDLLKRFVFRFNFAQTVVLPLPEPTGQKVFGRMLLDKLPKEFGDSKNWGFFDFATQRYIVFGNRSKCHFLGIPSGVLSDLSAGQQSLLVQGKDTRPQLSLWCELSPGAGDSASSVNSFVFESSGLSAEWMAHNAIGVFPVVDLPTGPDAWNGRKTLQKSTLQTLGPARSTNEPVLPEARLLADEHFWAGLPGTFFGVDRANSDRDISGLKAYANRDLKSEFRGAARGLSSEEIRQLKEELALVLGAN